MGLFPVTGPRGNAAAWAFRFRGEEGGCPSLRFGAGWLFGMGLIALSAPSDGAGGFLCSGIGRGAAGFGGRGQGGDAARTRTRMRSNLGAPRAESSITPRARGPIPSIESWLGCVLIKTEIPRLAAFDVPQQRRKTGHRRTSEKGKKETITEISYRLAHSI
jgi:hypothetical protein